MHPLANYYVIGICPYISTLKLMFFHYEFYKEYSQQPETKHLNKKNKTTFIKKDKHLASQSETIRTEGYNFRQWNKVRVTLHPMTICSICQQWQRPGYVHFDVRVFKAKTRRVTVPKRPKLVCRFTGQEKSKSILTAFMEQELTSWDTVHIHSTGANYKTHIK